MKMLKILLSIYSIFDFAIIVFLIRQYVQFLKSEEYESDTLLNRFIIACLAIGGIIFLFFLFMATVYYIFFDA